MQAMTHTETAMFIIECYIRKYKNKTAWYAACRITGLTSLLATALSQVDSFLNTKCYFEFGQPLSRTLLRQFPDPPFDW